MPAVMVVATERSATEGGTPNTEAIQNAIPRGSLSYQRPSERMRYGDWLAPAARVTRSLDTSSTGFETAHWYVTQAADVYGIPEALSTSEDAMTAILQEVIRRTTAALNQDTGGAWTVRVDPFEESLHGPLDWWVSGEAAHSPHWQSQFPYSGEADNPTGPDRGTQGSDSRIAVDDWVQQHDPANLVQDLGESGEKLINALKWIGGGALLLFLLYQWWQVSKASKASKEEAA